RTITLIDAPGSSPILNLHGPPQELQSECQTGKLAINLSLNQASLSLNLHEPPQELQSECRTRKVAVSLSLSNEANCPVPELIVPLKKTKVMDLMGDFAYETRLSGFAQRLDLRLFGLKPSRVGRSNGTCKPTLEIEFNGIDSPKGNMEVKTTV
ncbi:hypothetical protein Taro_051991, partial [Colocasia esculenta]|nr:hypothetical protein [Colocasia esculenta]